MRTFITLFLLSASSFAVAQSERKVVNTCGETYSANGIRLKVSVGEPIVGMLNTTNGSLSQGFFQSKPSLIIVPSPTTGYSFYPNPFKEGIQVKGDITKVKQFQLYDAVGRMILNTTITAGDIKLKGIAAGVYTARLIGENNAVIFFMKVVKL